MLDRKSEKEERKEKRVESHHGEIYNFVINCILATENHKFFMVQLGSFLDLMDRIIMKF